MIKMYNYNGVNNYVFVNGTESHTFKVKDSEIVATLLCIGNISKEFSVDSDWIKTLD